MKIEVGKKYIIAEGNITEIVLKKENQKYPFIDSDNIEYTNNGLYFLNETTEIDLICEVNEDIYTTYKQNLITKKEFLNKHFELYSGMTLEQYNAKNQDN